MGGAPSVRSPRRNKRAGTLATPRDRGISFRDTSIDANRRRLRTLRAGCHVNDIAVQMLM
eukprot:scaffold241700_cov28-Tisochrysis_lutea.AAC.1